VLCDLGSTAYYIGGIVEQAIGPSAPWFILAVMLFSYAVRSVYIESCSLFVRGGVYRVVKEAMGGFLAKLSVSALMFDYVLTGPISGVSAGQYLIGLGLEIFGLMSSEPVGAETQHLWKSWGAAAIASLITLYFFTQNLRGIHQSSDRAVKIVAATTVMAVLLLAWCGLTLILEGAKNDVPLTPDLTPKPDSVTGAMVSPLGFLDGTPLGDRLVSLDRGQWLSLIGVLGLLIAFGHSILAMSGEETLAQIYREVEAPKLPNLQKAALIVFIYSLVLTAGVSFLAVLLIPGGPRVHEYADNLIGGLAMSVCGPLSARMLLHAFVVLVGFLILAGAVNTAIIGSNGVLNRVAEDGVLPDWFLKPHARFGTTYRLLALILGLQLLTIVASRGDVLVLGEAYAFGVIWSFVFKSLAMVILRFKDPRPRQFQVPLNVRVAGYDVPIGLTLIFLVLAASAVVNLFTKATATEWGLGFTATFLTLFLVTERYRRKHVGAMSSEHLEQFNKDRPTQLTPEAVGLTQSYRRVVAVRSLRDLPLLEKILEQTDPATTGTAAVIARPVSRKEFRRRNLGLNEADQWLMTKIVELAETAGKEVRPLLEPGDEPIAAVVRAASELRAQELVVGISHRYSAEQQLDRIAAYWTQLHEGRPARLIARVWRPDRDVRRELGNGPPG
jgi:amino acid transporter